MLQRSCSKCTLAVPETVTAGAGLSQAMIVSPTRAAPRAEGARAGRGRCTRLVPAAAAPPPSPAGSSSRRDAKVRLEVTADAPRRRPNPSALQRRGLAGGQPAENATRLPSDFENDASWKPLAVIARV